ncbi:uncharacterized protein LOC129749447 [Uranotaenia lowii]|uniref:uncharacterized protein LOC129749447 n=1 Tax=Uranotaenia lowii TaxID=190385 RepID=UPI0024783E46|nr:uncharacterized protein LOC129749447 [Uranotaenia lowii]
MNLAERLQRFSLFRTDFNTADELYFKVTGIIDVINLGAGFSSFIRKWNFLNIRFIQGINTLFVYLYCEFTSATYYRNDMEEFLFCITTFGISIQCSAFIYLFILRRGMILDIHELNLKYYKLKSVLDAKIQKSLRSSSSITYLAVILTIIVYNVLMFLMACIPVIYTIKTNNKVLPYGFKMFFADTWTAYSLNMLFQFNCQYYVSICTVSANCTLVVLLLTAFGQIDAIIELFNQLQEMTQIPETPEESLKEKIEEIIALHQYHRNYMRKIVDSFDVFYLIVIGSLCSCMAISLTAIVLVNWYVGGVFICFSSAQIFYLCFFGAQLQIKSEKLTLRVTSFDWYNLPVGNQKSTMMILNACQTPVNLSAVFETLNYEAFLKVHKGVYSIFMFLISAKQ